MGVAGVAIATTAQPARLGGAGAARADTDEWRLPHRVAGGAAGEEHARQHLQRWACRQQRCSWRSRRFPIFFVQSYISTAGADCMAGWTSYFVDSFALLPITTISLAVTSLRQAGESPVRATHPREKGGRTALLLYPAGWVLCSDPAAVLPERCMEKGKRLQSEKRIKRKRPAGTFRRAVLSSTGPGAPQGSPLRELSRSRLRGYCVAV